MCVCGGAENDEDADDNDGIAFFIFIFLNEFFLALSFPSRFTGRYMCLYGLPIGWG